MPVCFSISSFLAPSLPAAQDRTEKLGITRIFYCLFIQYYYYYDYDDLILLLVLFSLSDPSKMYKQKHTHKHLGNNGGEEGSINLDN